MKNTNIGWILTILIVLPYLRFFSPSYVCQLEFSKIGVKFLLNLSKLESLTLQRLFLNLLNLQKIYGMNER